MHFAAAVPQLKKIRTQPRTDVHGGRVRIERTRFRQLKSIKYCSPGIQKALQPIQHHNIQRVYSLLGYCDSVGIREA